MNITRACVTGLDNIMSSYDLMAKEVPYYSVWFNKSDKCFQSNDDDKEAARQWLQDNLDMIGQQGDNAMYYLKIHPKSEPIYKRNSEEICSFPFRLNPLPGQLFNQDLIGGVGAYPQPQSPAVSQITAMIDRLNARLDAMEADAVPEEKPDTIDRIAGFLDHPNIGPAIGSVLGQLLPKIIAMIPGFGGPDLSTQNNAMMPAINGVPEQKTHTMTAEQEDELLNKALDRLEPFCDLANDLNLLADMAEKSPKMFEMMLSTLRAQK